MTPPIDIIDVNDADITMINVYLPNSGEIGTDTTDAQAENIRVALAGELRRRCRNADVAVHDAAGTDTIEAGGHVYHGPFFEETVISAALARVWDTIEL